MVDDIRQDADAAPSPVVVEDPHKSKIDPDDPRLRIGKGKGRSLKKGPIIFLCVSVVCLIAVAFLFALLPSAMKSNAAPPEEEEEAVASKNDNAVPEFIRLAPDNDDPIPTPVVESVSPAADKPDYVPPLGEKLPGDLGAAMVEPAQKPVQPAAASHRPSQPSKEQVERQKAMGSTLFFSGGPSRAEDPRAAAAKGVNDLVDAYKQTMQGISGGGKSGGSIPNPMEAADQNRQNSKNNFLQGGGARDADYVQASLVQPRSPYEIKAGTIIPISLVTGLNSDLPGEVIGQVRENVYDTVSGNYLLVPQGTRVMASYDSAITYGQNRVLICWNRLIRPDGSSIQLECMPGVDLDGFAGFSGKVDNHYLRLIGGVVLSSLLSATVTTSQGNNIGQNDLTFDQVFASNVGSNINDVGQQITKKNLEVQPTIKVPAGDSVNVLVNKDMIIPPYEAN